ncbi:MAG: hypothetical protein HQK49_17560 [Oligoflexia bacterium]|nr:hypothetical protein [Oligoflexia bacterium]
MGEKLLDYYKQAEKIGGGKARMRLAMITKCPSAGVDKVPDDPDKIKKFEIAMEEIRKEFLGGGENV